MSLDASVRKSGTSILANPRLDDDDTPSRIDAKVGTGVARKVKRREE